MNTYSRSEIRDLSIAEIDLVSGGGGAPNPTYTNYGMTGGHDVFQVSCPYGYGVSGAGTNGNGPVTPVAGNAYQEFICTGGAITEYAYAWQGSGGMWNVDATMTWG